MGRHRTPDFAPVPRHHRHRTTDLHPTAQRRSPSRAPALRGQGHPPRRPREHPRHRRPPARRGIRRPARGTLAGANPRLAPRPRQTRRRQLQQRRHQRRRRHHHHQLQPPSRHPHPGPAPATRTRPIQQIHRQARPAAVVRRQGEAPVQRHGHPFRPGTAGQLAGHVYAVGTAAALASAPADVPVGRGHGHPGAVVRHPPLVRHQRPGLAAAGREHRTAGDRHPADAAGLLQQPVAEADDDLGRAAPPADQSKSAPPPPASTPRRAPPPAAPPAPSSPPKPAQIKTTNILNSAPTTRST